MAQRICGLLELKITIRSGCDALLMGVHSHFFDSVLVVTAGLRPATTTHLSHVEVLGHLPGKALVQAGVVIDGLVSVLTALGLLFLYHWWNVQRKTHFS